MAPGAPPTVTTLGSHSALQILKGARDEGLTNLVIAAGGRDALYRRYPFVDEVVAIPSYGRFSDLEDDLRGRGALMVPHGSFVAYLGEDVNARMNVGYYGNRDVLRWEGSRDLQRRWLTAAGIPQPAEYPPGGPVEAWPVLVKTPGAAGGAGYFLARSDDDLARQLAERGLDQGEGAYTIQRYILGVTLYIHYFRSVMRDRLEILSMDRRYETNADGLGRLPHEVQAAIRPSPSYVVVGNSELVLRESMLEEAYQMGERVVATAAELIGPRGFWGPFCLETIVTPDLRFHVMEISCRIVAGTNLFVDGSPYASLFFDEPMSTGRRIARELREAWQQGRLGEVIDGPYPGSGQGRGAAP